REYPEMHYSSLLHNPIFLNLFASQNCQYIIGQSHTANGERRNDKDDDKTRLSLIPDSKLINKKMNKEILVIEKAKKTYVEDRRKFKTDKTKLGILLHDQITSIYKELSQEEKGDNIDKLKSFGIQTSATIQGIGNLSGLLLLLIQLRSIIFQNCNIMNGIFGNLSNDDDRSTPPLQKKWLVEIERIEIDCNYDDIITLGIDTQILINWPKPKIAVLPNSLALSVIKFEAMTPAEMLHEHQRALQRAQREMDPDIKKAAKENQMSACKIIAKDLVRTRRYTQKFQGMKAQLQASIIFQNCNIMNGIFGNLSNDDDRSTPPLQKKWLVEIERIEIDCNYDDIITLGIDTQILINWPKPKIAVLPNSLALSVIKFEAMGYRYIKNNNNNSYADEEINNIYNSIKAVNNNLTKHELLIDNKILSTNEQ
ncbi:4200_t:CDS:10, partial [Entrophospora sp. SA101]